MKWWIPSKHAMITCPSWKEPSRKKWELTPYPPHPIILSYSENSNQYSKVAHPWNLITNNSQCPKYSIKKNINQSINQYDNRNSTQTNHCLTKVTQMAFIVSKSKLTLSDDEFNIMMDFVNLEEGLDIKFFRISVFCNHTPPLSSLSKSVFLQSLHYLPAKKKDV